VRPVTVSAKPDAGAPLIDQPGILPGADVSGPIGTAWEDVVAEHPAPAFQPGLYAGASGLEQLELHGSAGLLLDDGRSCSDPAATNEISDPNFDDVTTPQLAVDGQIEKGAVAKASLAIQPKPYRPHLPRLQRPLGAHRVSNVPGTPLPGCWIEL
jgi:hypothetical protein